MAVKDDNLDFQNRESTTFTNENHRTKITIIILLLSGNYKTKTVPSFLL